jgi:hypothetical protein
VISSHCPPSTINSRIAGYAGLVEYVNFPNDLRDPIHLTAFTRMNNYTRMKCSFQFLIFSFCTTTTRWGLTLFQGLFSKVSAPFTGPPSPCDTYHTRHYLTITFLRSSKAGTCSAFSYRGLLFSFRLLGMV